MQKTPAGWTIIDRDAAVLTYDYEFTKGATSTTLAVRMPNGEMLLVSPPSKPSDEMIAELREFGEVGALLANNGFHHMGQADWRARFPDARSFAPAESLPRLKKKSTVEFEPISALLPLLGPNIGVRQVADTKHGESWLWAQIEGGYVWYLSDVLANMPSLPKPLMFKILFKITGSAPGFRVFNMALKFIVKDKKKTLRTLLEDMAANPPTVIVPSHGDILSQPGLATEARELVEAAL